MSTTAPQLSAGRVAARFDWRRAVVGLAAAVFGTAVALYLTTKTSHGAGLYSIGVVLAVVALAWMFSTRRVELALGIAVAYLGLLDGFLRLKTGSSTLTMARDAFLYSVALGMLLRAIHRGERFRWPPLTAWVVGWTAFVLVQLMNPLSGPTLHRLVSLRQDLEFVPLFFIGYAIVRSRARLRSLLTLLLVIGAVNGVVGLYQSTLSPGQLAGWGTGYANLLTGKNGAPSTAVGADGKQIVRPPALGGDMGFAGAVGMTVLPGGIALLLIGRRRNAERLLIGGLVILTTLGIITSQSRADVLSGVVGLVAFAAMLAASREGKKVLVGLLVFGAVVAVALSSLSSGALYRYSSITPNQLSSTVTTSRSGNNALVPKYMAEFPFGAGIGSSGPAYHQYGAAANTVSGESQITFLIGEVGVPGLILFLAFQCRVLGGAVRRLRKVDDSQMRILLAAVIAPLFAYVANWYVGTNTTSPPNATYMWGAIGILSFWLFSKRIPANQPPE